jgi:hypothetical protein
MLALDMDDGSDISLWGRAVETVIVGLGCHFWDRGLDGGRAVHFLTSGDCSGSNAVCWSSSPPAATWYGPEDTFKVHVTFGLTGEFQWEPKDY